MEKMRNAEYRRAPKTNGAKKMKLKFSIFESYPELIYGMTQKKDGPMKIFDAEKQKEIETHKSNKEKYFAKLEFKLADLVQGNLAAGNKVFEVLNKNGKFIDDTDALATKKKNIVLGITVADCFPIYFYEPESGLIALAHSGWRGTAKNIAGETIKKINIPARSFLVGIGPGIRSCHFDVKEEVLKEFKDYPKFISQRDGKSFIDLPGIIKYQLISAGIKEENMEDCGECTFCLDEKYFSWRREHDKMAQGLAYIGLKEVK
jgi:YfiH family protein